MMKLQGSVMFDGGYNMQKCDFFLSKTSKYVAIFI